MRKLYDAIIWLFLFPGDLVADWFGVTEDENHDLVRMLINSLFWIGCRRHRVGHLDVDVAYVSMTGGRHATHTRAWSLAASRVCHAG